MLPAGAVILNKVDVVSILSAEAMLSQNEARLFGGGLIRKAAGLTLSPVAVYEELVVLSPDHSKTMVLNPELDGVPHMETSRTLTAEK